ncbi:MAG: hypothetical protein Q4D19_04675 [Lautropia sp.]|nr:hypothetical protein [Lautropia sp.]
MQAANRNAGRIRARWVIAGLVVVCYAWSDWEARTNWWEIPHFIACWCVGMHALFGVCVRYLHLLNGPDVEVWIPRAEKRFRLPALIGAGVAALLVGNLWLCQWMLPTQIKEISVHRRLCDGSKLSDSPVKSGNACFTKWTDQGDGWSADTWWVDVDLMQGDIKVHSEATLTVEVIDPDSPWNWGKYARVISVR